MQQAKPNKTFRGTWDEVLAHQSEIPRDSVVELKVFEATREPAINGDNLGDFGGTSAAEMISEIGFVDGLPSDLSQRAEEYLAEYGFGETKSPRQLS